VVLFSVVSVCGSVGVWVIVNAITPQPFHKISMAARYGQKLGRLQKLLHTDALRHAWCPTFCLHSSYRPSTLFNRSLLCVWAPVRATRTVEQALSVSSSDMITDFNSLGYEFLQRDALHTIVTLFECTSA